MKTISLKPINRRPQVHTDERILDALLAEQLDVLMACGGKGLCATCHVCIEEGGEQLSEIQYRERRTLERLSNSAPNSRLACQARVHGEGVAVRLPEGMYVVENKDLEELIGQRAEVNILHPVDGSLLIPEGKIITRSFIMKLADIDADLAEIRAEAPI
jgi:ferredoxin